MRGPTSDSHSAPTEVDTQSSETTVSTLKQDEGITMDTKTLIFNTFHSKKPKSRNDVVQDHQTTDSLTPHSLSAHSICGSFDEVGLVSDLAIAIDKEDKVFELRNDVELGCRLDVGKKHLLEEIDASIMACGSTSTLETGETRNGFQDEFKGVDSDRIQADDNRFLGNDDELGCRLKAGKKHFLEDIEVAGDSTKTLGTSEKRSGFQEVLKVIDSESDHIQAYDNKFLGNDDELGCRSKVEKNPLLGDMEASIMAGDSKTSSGAGRGFQDELKKVTDSDRFLRNDDELGSRLRMELEASKVINGDSRCSLEILVVDETALIGSVSVPKHAKKVNLVAESKSTKSHGNKKAKEDMAETKKKKAKGSQRRPKGGKRVVLKNGERSKMVYSKEAMEALRFVNIVEQRKMWKDVHTGLGPLVRREYDYLVSSKNQKNFHFNFAKEDEPTSVINMVAPRGRSNHVKVFVH